MTTKPPPVSFFTPDELARLAERARLDVQAGVKGEPVKKGQKRTDREEEAAAKREHARRVRGLAGLRVAARCYALERDPRGLTPIVWGAWGVHAAGDIFQTHVDSEERIATAVASVGARVLEVPGLAERLAGSPLRQVRLALAQALPDSSEPILRALANDDDPEVRKAARSKVGDDDRWGGAFPIAPDGHPVEVLEAARRVLDKRAYDREVDEAVQAFAPLSDALAVACWERVLAPYRIGKEQHRAWLACLCERPGGGAALTRLLALWNRDGHYIGQGITVAPLSEEVRARVFSDLLAAVREREQEERASEGEPEQPHLRQHLATVAVQLAPEAGDARALLETILGCPIERASDEPASEGFDHAAHTLSTLLARWPLEALRAELVAARRAGVPGRWKRVSQAVFDGLGPDPVLRERARRELEDDSAEVRAAAVRALLGPLYDPSEDGELEAVARELYRRPALRAAVLRKVDALLSDARRDLDAGELDLSGAIVVLERTPAEEQTDALWSAVRALRARAISDPDDPSWRDIQACQRLIRPGEEWEPSDLAYARAIVEHAFTVPKAEGHLAFLIGILERKPGEESAALLREIDERATTDRLREVVQAGRNMSEAHRAIGH